MRFLRFELALSFTTPRKNSCEKKLDFVDKYRVMMNETNFVSEICFRMTLPGSNNYPVQFVNVMRDKTSN